MVTEKFPALGNKTVQNIIDQKRTILTRQRICSRRLAEIKSEVLLELGLIQPLSAEVVIEEARLEVPDEAQCVYEAELINYAGMNPENRPKLPKLRFNKLTNQIVKRVNELIITKISGHTGLTELNLLVYVGAVAVLKLHGQNPIKPSSHARQNQVRPWEVRLRKQVVKLRKEIGQMTALIRPNPSDRVKNAARKIMENRKNGKNTTAVEILDLLKQMLAVKVNRLKRYKLSELRRTQNRMFENSEKLLYQSLEKTQQIQLDAHTFPEPEAMKNFWSQIWSEPETHCQRAAWIKEERNKMRNIPHMCDHNITEEEVAVAVKRTLNWKAAGVDQIQNYWYKRFRGVHQQMALAFSNIISNVEEIPEFFPKGVTHLIPKTEVPNPDPSKFRPITCLNTMYKIFTSILTTKINRHVDQNNILAVEQKGCRKQHQGCKEQLIADMVIMEGVKSIKGNIFTCYIDYRKAFDSVPHTWLVEVLKIYKVDTQLTNVLENLMCKWSTVLTVSSSKLAEVNIRRGIFQGDSFSPLWFCLALNPMSTILNKTTEGYTFPSSQERINHLLYMDDLKLYATSRAGLDKLMSKTEKYSRDIKMSFGIEKCRINILQKGKVCSEGECYRLENSSNNNGGNEVMIMSESEIYKYLGVQQSRGTEHRVCKQILTEKYRHRLNRVLKSQLSGKHKIKALNTYAIPVLTYSFGVLNWTNTDLESLNRLTRTCSTKHRIHHPKSAIERFNLPRKMGGRGVVDILNLHSKQILNLRKYFYDRVQDNNFYMQVVNSDKSFTPLNLSNSQRVICVIDNCERVQNWMAKKIHARYPTSLSHPDILQVESHAWLTRTNMFSETEGFVIAIQDGVIATRNYRKYIIKDAQVVSDKCRMCNATSETLDHLISSCTTLAPVDYTDRHNNVAKIVHMKLCAIYNLGAENIPYYKYKPPSVLENERVKIYWDRQILTDHPIQNNIPDILVVDIQAKTTYVIDVAIPHASNVSKKHIEKLTKYTPLANEIKAIWDQDRVRIVPIIVGATGEIPRTLIEGLKILGIRSEVYIQLQKAVLLSTCAVVRKVLYGDTSNLQ